MILRTPQSTLRVLKTNANESFLYRCPSRRQLRRGCASLGLPETQQPIVVRVSTLYFTINGRVTVICQSTLSRFTRGVLASPGAVRCRKMIYATGFCAGGVRAPCAFSHGAATSVKTTQTSWPPTTSAAVEPKLWGMIRTNPCRLDIQWR